MRTRSVGLALALATACVSGFNIFVNGYAIRAFADASAYTTAKNLVAALALLATLVVAARLRPRAGLALPRGARQWSLLVLVGIVGGSVPFLLFFQGLALASSTQAAFIQKTLVVWVAVLAVVFLRERLGVAHVAAIVLIMAGQIALQTGIAKIGVGVGELMILAATLLWAVELVVAKRLLASLSALTVGAGRMGIGVIALLGYVSATGASTAFAGYGAEQWGWVLATGALLALYVGLWYAALARAQAVDVTAVLVFGAVVTAGLNEAVRGVALAPQAGGLALIAAGAAVVVLAATRDRRRTAIA